MAIKDYVDDKLVKEIYDYMVERSRGRCRMPKRLTDAVNELLKVKGILDEEAMGIIVDIFANEAYCVQGRKCGRRLYSCLKSHPSVQFE